jgi:hypothetical protein
MKRASTLMLLAALSLAAGALAATPAVAATVTHVPHGTFPITVLGTSGQSSFAGPITITCQSTINATIVDTSGAGTLDSLSFFNCVPAGCTFTPAVGADAGTVTVTAIAGPATAGTIGTATSTGSTHDADNTRVAGDLDATQTGVVTIDATDIDVTLTCVFTCTFTPASSLPFAANESVQVLTVTNVAFASTTFFCGSATWSTTYGLDSPAGGLTLDA